MTSVVFAEKGRNIAVWNKIPDALVVLGFPIRFFDLVVVICELCFARFSY